MIINYRGLTLLDSAKSPLHKTMKTINMSNTPIPPPHPPPTPIRN